MKIKVSLKRVKEEKKRKIMEEKNVSETFVGVSSV